MRFTISCLVILKGNARRSDNIFFDHDTAEVVCPEFQRYLGDLRPLGDPRRLDVREIIEHDTREGEGLQVLHGGCGASSQLCIARLVGPGMNAVNPWVSS